MFVSNLSLGRVWWIDNQRNLFILLASTQPTEQLVRLWPLSFLAEVRTSFPLAAMLMKLLFDYWHDGDVFLSLSLSLSDERRQRGGERWREKLIRLQPQRRRGQTHTSRKEVAKGESIVCPLLFSFFFCFLTTPLNQFNERRKRK